MEFPSATESPKTENHEQRLKTVVCSCGRCNNRLYVPCSSEEFMFRYCPYCGIQFKAAVRPDGTEKTMNAT